MSPIPASPRGAQHGPDHDPLITPRESAVQASPLNRRRIVEAIESQLASKGFRKAADTSGADFILSFTVGARERIDVQSYPVRYRGYWGWGGAYVGYEANVSTYREGTLAIDIFDARSRAARSSWPPTESNREALPLLQLWRRHAHPLTGSFFYPTSGRTAEGVPGLIAPQSGIWPSE